MVYVLVRMMISIVDHRTLNQIIVIVDLVHRKVNRYYQVVDLLLDRRRVDLEN